MKGNVMSEASAKVPGRGFWPLRDLPTAIWLILLVLSTLIHRQLPAPRWLMIHLLLLGALSHAILVWSQYFATALLKQPVTQDSRRQQSRRLLLLNAGAVVVMTGVLGAWWPVTACGAGLVAAAALWHGVWLYRRLRGALPSPYGASVRYYVAAAALLPVGAALGTWISTGLPSPLHERLTLAHALVNLLGWVGLTVAGTLITLWPTMLRTRIAPQAAARLRHSLPVLLAAVLIAAAGAGFGVLPVAAAGVAGYLVGLGLLASPFIYAARNKPPRSFATLSVLAAVCWWVGMLVWMLVGLVTTSDWRVMGRAFDTLAPYLVAGFAAQVLLGALSYLIPVALGGGPRPVRETATVFDRGAAWRVSMANTALLVCALPVSSLVRVVCSVLYLVAMASFLPLLFAALRTHRKVKAQVQQAKTLPAAGRPRGPRAPEGERPAGQRAGQAVAGFMAVVVAIALGVALDPAAAGLREPATSAGQQQSAAEVDAPVQRVQVTAQDMRFFPARIDVQAGTHLIIELTNTDAEQTHDLVLGTGQDSGWLAPGQSAEVDAGVVGASVDGWCSIVGHKQMGMVLEIVATGQSSAGPGQQQDPGEGEAPAQDGSHHMMGREPQDQGPAAPDAASELDFNAAPQDGFTAREAELEPLAKDAGEPVTHRHRFTVSELQAAVAPGVTQKLWTFNGTAPGPVLHGRVGDRFEITLYNDGSMGHSIDFHAGALAPDEPMRTIAPGQSLTYRFTATKAGIWMYHCGTAPMSAHIANGMFGTVVIEPDDLPQVDKSFVLTQSDFYLGAQGGEVDMDKLLAGTPDIVAFNGYANQYLHQPLRARAGERVRIWLLDAGPNRPSSFHVIGGQFDTVWFEGGYRLDHRQDPQGGSQALALAPAQGGFVELVFPEAGHYPFVTHYMSDGERGAHGLFEITGENR